jgi:DNA-binding transcriptional LysR family regulator
MAKRDRKMRAKMTPLNSAGINLRSIEVFLRVVETGGMTSAARLLGLSQSAVSQSILSLEKELNVQLLDRSERPVAPTVSGSLLIEEGRELLRAAQEAVTRVRAPVDSKIPLLRLALSDSMAAAVGPYLIPDLRNEAVKCSIFSGLSTSHMDLLLEREVDIIISADPFEDIDGLYRQEIFAEPYVLLVPSGYPKQIESLEALARFGDLIRFSARSSSGQHVERHLRRLRLKIPQHFEFDTAEAVFSMVATGIGWTITTPICLLQAQHRIKNARLLPIPKPGLKRRVTLLSREGEFTGIAARIAAWTRSIISKYCLPEFRKISPWMEKNITIHDGFNAGLGPTGPP